MSVVIIGGIKSLDSEYKKILSRNMLKGKVFNTMVPNFDRRIKNADAVIMFTNTMSHKMATNCNKLCRKRKIKLIKSHSSSICSLELAITELIKCNCLNCNKCIYE